MHDHGVAESLGAATHEILVVETVTSPAVSVVVESRVDLEVRVGPAKEFVAILTEHDGLLDPDELVAHDAASDRGVLGRHQVRVHPVRQRRP